MKLGIVSTDPKECTHGGVSPIIRNMHDKLSEAFDVDYLYLSPAWKRFPLPDRLKSMMFLALKWRRMKSYDFILSHIPEGSYVVSLTGKPYAHIFHGNYNPMNGSRYWFGKYFKFIFEHFAKRIHKTAQLKYSVGPAVGDTKKLINPIKHNVSRKPADMKSGFIFAGRLEAVKNIGRIIEIYAQLPESIRQTNKLYIAGAGTQESNLKKAVSDKSLDNDVIFLGSMANRDLIECVSTKKIILMASDNEGFPTAIAEALTVGVPVVTTISGDIPTFIKDGVNGHLFPQKFENRDYINAIRDILDNYESFSENAFESSRVFDSDVITQAVIDDINDVINRKKG